MPMLKMSNGTDGWIKPNQINYNNTNLQIVYLWNQTNSTDVIVWRDEQKITITGYICPTNTILNLKNYITSLALPEVTKFDLTINSNVGPITTGDLTGLEVKLIINSGKSISGSTTYKNALTITSPFQLINNGTIRGAGGEGGRGGTSTLDYYTINNITTYITPSDRPGGAGGHGVACNQAWTAGEQGVVSSPTGYDGGVGGDGGQWGEWGKNGLGSFDGSYFNSTLGTAGGYSVTGKSLLKPGSTLGTLIGVSN